MLLAAGALTALAFAALPAVASAQEYTATCSAVPCVGTVQSTGHALLTDDSGLGITCLTTTGTVTQAASPSSTVSVALTFDGCKDTVFGFECNNEGAGTGKILANTLTGHIINVGSAAQTLPGILLTGANTTFVCPALGIERTVTGNIIGTFENPTTQACKAAQTHHTITFESAGTGIQKHKTYTGVTHNLTSGPHASDKTESSQFGTAHINYGGGKTVSINC